MSSLWYGDEVCGDEVELHDRIKLRDGDYVHDGVVTILHPFSHEVTVRYEDCLDTTRSGRPRKKIARVHIMDCDLIRRGG